MPRATIAAATSTGSKIELEYDTTGDPADPALVLVMGLTAQMIAWDDAFVKLLADGGRYVVRFDNRDCGLSTKFDGVEIDMAVMMGALLGTGPMPDVPYTLSDMATDVVGLLDELSIDTAHIAGVSMGGMIAQTVAIEHPARVRTLTSIMSTTGELEYGQPQPAAMQALMTPPPTEREAFIERGPAMVKLFAGQRYFDADRVRQRMAEGYDRSFYPEGGPRQTAAILASGSRADALRELRVPTLVIHGRGDTLISPSGGERTAELIPGANLFLLTDMGHDLPEPLWPLITDAILSHTRYAVG